MCNLSSVAVTDHQSPQLYKGADPQVSIMEHVALNRDGPGISEDLNFELWAPKC